MQAVEEVQRLLKEGRTEVVDADLARYFDTIPHAELMKCMARRIGDGAVLHLIGVHVPILTKNAEENRSVALGSVGVVCC